MIPNIIVVISYSAFVVAAYGVIYNGTILLESKMPQSFNLFNIVHLQCTNNERACLMLPQAVNITNNLLVSTPKPNLLKEFFLGAIKGNENQNIACDEHLNQGRIIKRSISKKVQL